MGPIGATLQDNFLNLLRKEKTPVVIFLTNGVRLKGVIKGFDNFVVVLKEATSQLVYKHAISTIMPQKDVDLKDVLPQRAEQQQEQ